MMMMKETERDRERESPKGSLGNLNKAQHNLQNSLFKQLKSRINDHGLGLWLVLGLTL